MTAWKKLLILAAATVMLSSCGVITIRPAYYWGGRVDESPMYTGEDKKTTSRYESLAYRYYDLQTPQTICELICTYEKMVSQPTGRRRVPPPGICAEYAYLISQPETVEIFIDYATRWQRSIFKTDDFRGYFKERSDELFRKEMELYPESIVFIKPIHEQIKEK